MNNSAPDNHFLISLILFAFGKSIDLIAEVQPLLAHYQIPIIIMQTMQCLAYAGTGTAGIIAGYKFYDEKIKNKLKKRKR